MTKAEIRKKYKELRNQLSSDNVEQMSLEIANQLLQLPIWKHSFYHLFLSIQEKKEVNTEYILHILSGKDKNIVLSKSDFSNCSMQHFLLTDATVIKKNRWNIPEPEDGIQILDRQIEVVFVPLLAFDKTGNRVGYGKGFYDRFLENCSPDVVKIGLSFFEAESEEIPTDKNDVQLDFCITPKQVYTFS